MSALYLQAFDNQPGISVPFRELDYGLVERWLDRILTLDPRTQYPLIMASQLYAQVPDAAKQRAMLDFVHRRFLDDPRSRWRWLAHATLVAKHRLHDLERALRFADEQIGALIKELRSLALNAEILDPNDEEIPLTEDDTSGYLKPDLGGINLAGFED